MEDASFYTQTAAVRSLPSTASHHNAARIIQHIQSVRLHKLNSTPRWCDTKSRTARTNVRQVQAAWLHVPEQCSVFESCSKT
jgi:hypothetical protein